MSDEQTKKALRFAADYHMGADLTANGSITEEKLQAVRDKLGNVDKPGYERIADWVHQTGIVTPEGAKFVPIKQSVSFDMGDMEARVIAEMQDEVRAQLEADTEAVFNGDPNYLCNDCDERSAVVTHAFIDGTLVDKAYCEKCYNRIKRNQNG